MKNILKITLIINITFNAISFLNGQTLTEQVDAFSELLMSKKARITEEEKSIADKEKKEQENIKNAKVNAKKIFAEVLSKYHWKNSHEREDYLKYLESLDKNKYYLERLSLNGVIMYECGTNALLLIPVLFADLIPLSRFSSWYVESVEPSYYAKGSSEFPTDFFGAVLSKLNTKLFGNDDLASTEALWKTLFKPEISWSKCSVALNKKRDFELFLLMQESN